MPKVNVALTLDGQSLDALRGLVGRRRLSAAVDRAISAHVKRVKHLASLDEWLAELDDEHGRVPHHTLDRAKKRCVDPSNGLRIA